MTYRWPKPEGISSAVTLPELELLQTYAAEARRVLEIGTHFGFSCIGMALAGAHVISVDPHYEGPANAPDTWAPFLANVERHGVRDRVFPHRLPVEEWIDNPGWTIRHWGMAFIDGDHVWPYPLRDARIAERHMTSPGHLAFHDVTERWPGVYRAVTELQAEGWKRLDQVGTLAVYQKSASSVSGMSSTPTLAL